MGWNPSIDFETFFTEARRGLKTKDADKDYRSCAGTLAKRYKEKRWGARVSGGVDAKWREFFERGKDGFGGQPERFRSVSQGNLQKLTGATTSRLEIAVGFHYCLHASSERRDRKYAAILDKKAFGKLAAKSIGTVFTYSEEAPRPERPIDETSTVNVQGFEMSRDMKGVASPKRGKRFLFSLFSLTAIFAGITIAIMLRVEPAVNDPSLPGQNLFNQAVEARKVGNEPEYLRLINQASDEGNTVASAAVAVSYIDGGGRPKNENLADKYGQNAIDHGLSDLSDSGDAWAQYYLGLFYYYGVVLSEDKSMALELLTSAKVLGLGRASYSIGVIYYLDDDSSNDCEGLENAHLFAASGDPSGSELVGNYYSNGKCKSVDEAKAIYWYRRAADVGLPSAQAALGRMYELGHGVIEDAEEAITWYLKAAEQGDENGQIYLGLMYLYGRGVPQDDKKAAKYFAQAANQGDPEGQYDLGWMYENGRGVEKDCAEAFRLYQLSSEQDFVDAITSVGLMYEVGCGVAQNDEAATEFYQVAAEKGQAWAQYNLGQSYFYGRGILQNDDFAASWYQRAADQGHAKAQNSIGWMYQVGRGVPQDYKEAVKWYELAVEQNYDWAQYNLGWMYFLGHGVSQSDEEAVSWFRKSAEQGNLTAATKLGWMYENGRGVELDYDAALTWYHKAADQGYAWAEANLGWMYVNGHDPEHGEADAFELFLESAEKKDSWGLYGLGMAYLFGYGANISVQDGAETCRLGNTACTKYCLGLAYFRQEDGSTIVTPAEAEQALVDSANENNTCAATLLGVAYSVGKFGRPPELNLAEWWLRRASDAGNNAAKYNLAVFLMRYRNEGLFAGSEVEELLSQSAQEGEVPSICAMAAFHLSGEYTTPSLLKASSYLRSLVDLGEMSETDAERALEEAAFSLDDTDAGDLNSFVYPGLSPIRADHSATNAPDTNWFVPGLIEGEVVIEYGGSEGN